MSKDKIRFELNKAGVRELLKSQQMMAVLKQEAQGHGYQIEDSFTGINRCKLRAKGGNK